MCTPSLIHQLIRQLIRTKSDLQCCLLSGIVFVQSQRPTSGLLLFSESVSSFRAFIAQSVLSGYYHPQQYFRKGNVFTSVCQEFYPQGGMPGGGMHGRGACVAGACVTGGHVWQGVCVQRVYMAGAACMAGRLLWQGCAWRGHAWQRVYMAGEACMAGRLLWRGCAWQGACMAVGVHGRGGMHGRELLTLSFIHNHSILFVIIMKDEGPTFLNLV